jgi:Mg-chelatase subunit ChlD
MNRVLRGLGCTVGLIASCGFLGCDFFETWDEGEPVDQVLPSGGYTTGSTPDGMDFQLAVTPLDQEGRLITGGVTAKSFTFRSVYVYAVDDSSGYPVTHSSETVVQRIEILSGADSMDLLGVLAMDSSGSMSDSDPGRIRVQAAKEFIGLLRDDDLLAIVHFGLGSADYELLHDFSSDRASLGLATEGVVEDGGTPLNDGILYALDLIAGQMTQGSVNGVFPAIVVLTDGQENESEATLNDVIARAIALGVPVFAVGLGTDVDSAYLTRLAVETQGEFVMAEQAQDLVQQFRAQMVANTQGRVVVHGRGRFASPLSSGSYVVRGFLDADINGGFASTAFSLLLTVP